MLTQLPATKPDPILAAMDVFRADPRPHKLDLGVGVYKDEKGTTPIMKAVRQAEQLLWDAQTTKTYLGVHGDPDFSEAIADWVLADAVTPEHLSMAQAVGGSGALRLLFDVVRMANPAARVWLPSPTWPNHEAIVRTVGLEPAWYPYLDPHTHLVDFDAMQEGLSKVGAGDVVVLHGCCHNPSGADINAAQWATLANMATAQGWTPLIDLAYVGFGDGIEADTKGVRLLLGALQRGLLAISCSKNFGMYRDRVGCAMVVTPPSARDRAMGVLGAIARTTYSMPPDHGAAVVRMVLRAPPLRKGWLTELDAMRTRMGTLRGALADALARHTNDDRFGYLRHHKGMFSLVGATQAKVDALRDTHAIYVVGAGRINIAGMPIDEVDRVAQAFLAVGL